MLSNYNIKSSSSSGNLNLQTVKPADLQSQTLIQSSSAIGTTNGQGGGLLDFFNQANFGTSQIAEAQQSITASGVAGEPNQINYSFTNVQTVVNLSEDGSKIASVTQITQTTNTIVTPMKGTSNIDMIVSEKQTTSTCQISGDKMSSSLNNAVKTAISNNNEQNAKNKLFNAIMTIHNVVKNAENSGKNQTYHEDQKNKVRQQ
jgi:hypothetical protein